MKKRKLIAGIVAASIVLAAVGTAVYVSNKGNNKYQTLSINAVTPGYRTNKTAVVSEENKLHTVESNELKLTLNSEDMTLSINDKRNGKNWNSYFNKEDLGREPNTLWEQNIKALMNFSYIDATKKSNDIMNKNNLSEMGTMAVEKIENGFCLVFNFTAVKIQISMNLQILGDELLVSIPENGIKEGEKFHLVSITPLPYFGSAKDTDEGYFFYPNGPGELFCFKEKEERLNSVKEYSLPVYSNLKVDLESKHNISEFDKEEIKVMLPVYGVKNGDNAFVTIVEQGDSNTKINIIPGGVSVSANRINSTFIYRHDYSVESSGLSASGGTNNFPLAQMYDKELIPGNRVASYKFLVAEDANYSGMARETRKNFIAREILNPETSDKELPLVMDLFMGIVQNKMIFDEYITMTTFDQAADIAARLKENGISNVTMNLLGTGKKGYNTFSNNMPFSTSIGSNGDLKNLAALCRSQEYKLFVQASVMNIEKGVTKYSTLSDPAKDQNGFIYEDLGEKHFLFNPFKSLDNSKKFTNYAKKFGINGVVYEDIGKSIFDDFNKTGVSARENTAMIYSEIIKSTRDNLGYAAAEGGNAYVLDNAYILRDIPSDSSNILFSDKTVPFYQMVVHGSAYYTTTPINLFYDENQQLLKLVEYGYVPYFKLTNEPAFNLRDTEYNNLFNSRFENWDKSIQNIYSKMKADLGDTYNAQIISHEELASNVYMVTYSDKTKVYVNYNKTDFEKNGVKVGAVNYTVVR